MTTIKQESTQTEMKIQSVHVAVLSRMSIDEIKNKYHQETLVHFGNRLEFQILEKAISVHINDIYPKKMPTIKVKHFIAGRQRQKSEKVCKNHYVFNNFFV